MKRRHVLTVLAAAGLLFTGAVAVTLASRIDPTLAPWTLDPTDARVTLEDVEREVIQRYPVADITPASLAREMAAGGVVLLDVRTREEYEAGHLPGAIRVDPEASAQDILREHGDKLRGRAIVFYCAVGVRSSQLMMRTIQDLAPLTSAPLYNLRGGIFRWTADGRALVAGAEPGQPHPYDPAWGQLLSRTLPPS